MDDVQFRGYQERDLLKFKAEATQTLQEGSFELHKWHSRWSQFVRNRIKAISDSDIREWHFVSTGENPSDLGSR